MKNLFDSSTAEEIRNRLESLRPDSERRWGAMNVAQMLAHCTAWMDIASGRTSPPRSFMGRIFGKLAKKSILKNPVRRNMPTDKTLVMQGQKTFSAELQLLLDSVERFSNGGPALATTHPHSFFGPMTPGEWAAMAYKHMDHHLKQFGA